MSVYDASEADSVFTNIGTRSTNHRPLQDLVLFGKAAKRFGFVMVNRVNAILVGGDWLRDSLRQGSDGMVNSHALESLYSDFELSRCKVCPS
ncbi:hypothetical protein F5890DRAFT_1552046 [Lentinula detonsa]|uniref:Uncharacterized protein n=1 Tax=Lentinula detonsa TaxID=2804962 RepID=A0AA38UVM9_9AGAR|nr:hypothetical protein F5890DRAFT_1552046 [Lentinula detonsa]